MPFSKNQVTDKDRVRTEIGNQNSRTFPGLFKEYLYFFQGVIFHRQELT